MRNLKKILALVLALVMSLSLMATAGAKGFEDSDKVGETYQTAVEVLNGLGVFGGYDLGNGNFEFRPQNNITRAEVATIIYRIVTGDVKGEQAAIYTDMANSKLKDLNQAEWARGFVNYCYNAGIIKGVNDTDFEPNSNITGYAALTMILRAIGYGQNGEFVGNEWEINTASRARSLGLLNGITDAQLGQPASRELVAQILFRTMLKETVTWTALQGYQGTGTTLGKQQFGLEEIQGVVMANEWANLNTTGRNVDKVLAEGTTQMKVTKVQDVGATVAVDDIITLDSETESDPAAALDAVGLTYKAYIANGEGGAKKTLTLAKGDNNVAFNEGLGVNYPLADPSALNSKRNEGFDDFADLADEASIDSLSGAEYFINYVKAEKQEATSKWLVRYAIAKDSVAAVPAWANYIARVDANQVDGHSLTSRDIQVNWDINEDDTVDADDTIACWVVSIRIGRTINSLDLEIMYDIFDTADRIGNTNDEAAILPEDIAVGEVYVGTSSLTDQSDIKSWEDFEEDYLVYDGNGTFDACAKGNSLRIVDNNMDGVAEYVLAITYTQDKAAGVRKDALEFNSIIVNGKDYTGSTLYNPDELSTEDVGVIANYTVIDNKLYIWRAPVVENTKINHKNFQDITVTATVDDETYGQSDITIETGLMDDIMQTNDDEDYNLYLDQFGFIRSYELAQGKKYALLTEMYVTGGQAWNYVNTEDFIAEAMLGDADIDEYTVTNVGSRLNGAGAAFVNAAGSNAWTSREAFKQIRYNFLQPAIAHLNNLVSSRGYTSFDGQADDNNTYSEWNRAVSAMVDGKTTETYGSDYGVFDYGIGTDTDYPDGQYAGADTADDDTDDKYFHKFSFTNVGVYTQGDNEDEIALTTAAQLSTDNRGNVYYYGPDRNNVDRYGMKFTIDGWIQENLAWNAANPDEVARPTTAAGIIADNGYYPVYAVDYVQIDPDQLGTVKAGTRHFAISADYDTNYKTNSNGYVDATLDTMFYVVTPSGATLYNGYNELPTIDGDKVRATYAVARNTNADEHGVDYWVADVIVFEVTDIEYAYESISLMYYNPWETSTSVRYVRSLNNEWNNLQPDYEDLAKMMVVPARVSNGGSQSWGNWTWGGTDYGFYELYDTELVEDGELNAARVNKITSDWNDHGIYAGTVYRISGLLNSSGYIDVDKAGRGLVYPNPKDDNYVHVGMTTKDNGFDVPVYRITRANGMNSADTITLSETRWNQVELGDQIIWVMDHAKKNVSFVVDLGQAPVRGTLANPDYYIPAWLLGIYNDVIEEQVGIGSDLTAAQLIAKADELLADENATAAQLEALQEQLQKLVFTENEDGTINVGTEDTEKIDKLTVAEFTALQELLGENGNDGTVANAIAAAELKEAVAQAEDDIDALATAAKARVVGNDVALAAIDALVAQAKEDLAALDSENGDDADDAQTIVDDLEDDLNGIVADPDTADVAAVSSNPNVVLETVDSTEAEASGVTGRVKAGTTVPSSGKLESTIQTKTSLGAPSATADSEDVQSITFTEVASQALSTEGDAAEDEAAYTAWTMTINFKLGVTRVAEDIDFTITFGEEPPVEADKEITKIVFTADLTQLDVSSEAKALPTVTAAYTVNGEADAAAAEITVTWKNGSNETVTEAAATTDATYTATVDVTTNSGYKLAANVEYQLNSEAASTTMPTIQVTADDGVA